MNPQNKLSRRRFVQMAVLSAGGLSVFARCTKAYSDWRFFTGSEAKLMDALADQIIPPDDWPGGKESGVTNFIDKQLIGPYIRFQDTYRKGLNGIRESCKVLYQNSFESLDFDEQTHFLELMEDGKLTGDLWAGNFDRTFFKLFRDHSMQAYYGSSRHGGNKDNISYKMLKLDYPLIIGQNRYQN